MLPVAVSTEPVPSPRAEPYFPEPVQWVLTALSVAGFIVSLIDWAQSQALVSVPAMVVKTVLYSLSLVTSVIGLFEDVHRLSSGEKIDLRIPLFQLISKVLTIVCSILGLLALHTAAAISPALVGVIGMAALGFYVAGFVAETGAQVLHGT